jgi:hypothetical protein
VESALVHFDSKQRQQLTKRARIRGKSFAREVRDAVDLYLALPVESEAELTALAAAAHRSADRSLKYLDTTIATVDRLLKRRKNGRWAGHAMPSPPSAS